MAAMAECVAFSSSGNYFAYSTPNGRLLIWDTSSGDLKQEYVPSSHLSATCSCLAFNPSEHGEHSPKKKKRKADAQSSPNLELLAMGTTSGSILLYSVKRGSLYSQMEKGHSSKVHGVSWHAPSDSLFSCSADHHIVHWSLSSCKVKYKWKGDTKEIYSICVLDSKNLLTASGNIKWWDIEKRTVLKTFVGHAAEVCWLLQVKYPDQNVEGGYFMSAALNDRIVNAWQLKTEKEYSNPVVACNISDEPVQVEISTPSSRDEPVIMTAVTQSGALHIFEHQLNGKCAKPLQPKVTVRITDDGTVDPDGRPKPIHILASQVCNNKEKSILIAHGSFLRPTFEKIEVGECKKETWLIRQEKTVSVTVQSQVTKIKEPEKSLGAKVVAPGYMVPSGPKASSSRKTPMKRRHKDVTNSEMPMEARLNALRLEISDKLKSPTKAQTPRADNVVHLLLQGLQSKDRQILDTVFQKHDENLVQNTVKRLPIESIHLVMTELVHRLQSKGENFHRCLRWLRYILYHHTSYLMTCSNADEMLGPVHELLVSRTDNFQKFFRLRGKLDLMLSQINQVDDVVTRLPLEPKTVYQDSSEEEEEEEKVAAEKHLPDISSIQVKQEESDTDMCDVNGLCKSAYYNRHSDSDREEEENDVEDGDESEDGNESDIDME